MQFVVYVFFFLTLLLCPTAPRAEIVGAGTFEQVFPPIAPPPNPNFWTGTATFDNQSYVVQGQSVNMGTSVGTMDLNGYIEDFPLLNEVVFEYDAVSQTAGVFEFHNMGFLACPNCQQPQGAAFGGFVDTVTGTLIGTTLPAAGPGIGVYAISGVITCPSNVCNGPFALDYFAAESTPTGTDVSVPIDLSFYNPTTAAEESLNVDVQYDDVTGAGGTIAAPIWTITGAVPSEFSLDTGGFTPALFDLVTSASFTGSVAVCVSYPDVDDDGFVDGTTVSESSLRILHNESDVFVDRTDTVDTVANKVCGLVTSFSEFTTAVQTTITCASAPETECTVAAQAKLDVNEKKAGKEKLKLQWKKLADTTTQAQFGNPLAADSTSVALCIYDDSDVLVGQYLVDRSGDQCAGTDCWKAKGTKGYGYKDTLNASYGISKIGYVSGDPMKGKADAKGKNNSAKSQTALPIGVVSALNGSASPTIQIVTSDGFCATAAMTEIVKNDPGTRYKAQKK